MPKQSRLCAQAGDRVWSWASLWARWWTRCCSPSCRLHCYVGSSVLGPSHRNLSQFSDCGRPSSLASRQMFWRKQHRKRCYHYNLYEWAWIAISQFFSHQLFDYLPIESPETEWQQWYDRNRISLADRWSSIWSPHRRCRRSIWRGWKPIPECLKSVNISWNASAIGLLADIPND